MSPRSTPLPPQQAAGVAVLIQRLVARLDRRRAAPAAQAQAPKQPYAPPGQRSGCGSESVLPYLAESLQTRPGALED